MSRSVVRAYVVDVCNFGKSAKNPLFDPHIVGVVETIPGIPILPSTTHLSVNTTLMAIRYVVDEDVIYAIVLINHISNVVLTDR